MVYNSNIFINSNLSSYKNWKQNYKNYNAALILFHWEKVLFLPKYVDFLQENADISKIKGLLVLKGIFSETKYLCILTYQIQISSIILTSFRQGEGVILTLPSLQN